MDEELSILQDSVARFLRDEFVPHIERWDREQRVDRQAWLKAGAAGLLCASIPEEYGGGGGGYAHETVIAQEISRAGMGGGFGAGNGVSSALVAHYILAYASEDQKKTWLPKMAAGEMIGAIAMTEPGAGSDLQAVTTSARKVDGGYRINGQKTFISNGQNADLVVVVCKTDPKAGAKGMSLLALETAGAEGFRRGRNLSKIGMHAQDTSELFFGDVFVPDANLLGGDEGRGFFQLMQQLAWERLTCAFAAVVAMEQAVAVTSDYVKQRTAFGQPLMAQQNTQFKLAECKTKATVGRIFVDELMVRLLAGELDADVAAMAKLWTTEEQGWVVDQCLQLHGGYGYMTEYPIARLYADARVSRIFAGASEIMKLIIARTL
ncbi:MAG: acyl-CoA dehydrogenase domain protein [Caulobacter sp.]|nr:acyl-CoA dehydrogenase domain protein [Caulobacter sp.]